jgi:hypothetical protein
VDGKVDRLREAGLIMTSGELPREYQAVVDGLTDDELDIIVAVKRRLDEADTSSQAAPPSAEVPLGDEVRGGMPPFTSYMVF